MFIDIHTHVYRLAPPAIGAPPFCRPKELLARYDKMKVDYAVLLPIVSPEIYFPQAVEDILEICDQYPDRFIPYCNIDPRCCSNSPRAPLARVLSHYKALGCKGIGEVMPNLALMDPLVQNLFAAAEEVNLPIVYDGSIQLGGDFGLYDEAGMPQLEYTLQSFPKLRIFGHGPVFWNEIGPVDTPAQRGVFMCWNGNQVCRLPGGPVTAEGTVPKLLRKYDNLFGDLSDGTAYNAIARDENYGPRFLSEFEDKLYFGTDMCAPNMPVELDSLLISWRERGKISKTTFRKIAYDNAARLLDIH